MATLSSATLIALVNGTAGVLLSALLGLALAKARPSLARGAAPALLGLAAADLALLLAAVPLPPLALLLPLTFGSAAWAFGPLEPPRRQDQLLGAAAGVTVALLLAATVTWNLWWAIAPAGLSIGFLSSLWQARPRWLRPSRRLEIQGPPETVADPAPLLQDDVVR